MMTPTDDLAFRLGLAPGLAPFLKATGARMRVEGGGEEVVRDEARLSYRRGFVIAPLSHRMPNPKPLTSWNRVLTERHKVFVHPSTDVLKMEDVEERIALVFGDIFVAHGGDSLDQALRRFMGGDRVVLDTLAGRFAIAVFDGDACTIVHDPLGSQSVFYSTAGIPAAASHAALLAEVEDIVPSESILGYMSSPEYSSRGARFLPGDLTVFEDIVHLVPNNELDLGSGRTARFWPRSPVERTTFEDLKEAWHEYFTNYAAFLTPRYRPVLGLTGGKDSRTVIATLRSLGTAPRYVTWSRMDADEASRIEPMVKHLGGDHQWVDIAALPDVVNLTSMRQAARVAAGYTRGTPLLPAQMSMGAGMRDVFLRGLGGEVLRGPFHRTKKSHLPADPLERVYALYTGPIRKTASKSYIDFTRSAVKGYYERSHTNGQLFGADVGDLVYWEQRMGTWSSVQHAELSVAMNSHSAINSRALFEIAWGMSDEERFTGEMMLRLMRLYDPVLAEL